MKMPKKLTFTTRELSTIKWILETWKKSPPPPGKRRRKTTVGRVERIIEQIETHLQECSEMEVNRGA